MHFCVFYTVLVSRDASGLRTSSTECTVEGQNSAELCKVQYAPRSAAAKDPHCFFSIMGFPVTGQGYNIVAFSFYIGERYSLSLGTRWLTVIASRVLRMGFPDHVYIAAYTPWQISWGQYPRLGRHHDATRDSQVVRSLLCSAATAR